MRQEFFFEAAGERLAATSTTGADGAAPEILALHGLGPTASRHRVRYLLDAWAEHGHGSLTFDFSGNGDSSGDLGRSTLRRRREETLAASALLGGAGPPVVVGTSLGAHLAAWTVREVRPRALVMFCPATYPAHAADLPFGDGLTRPARHPDSPAYAALREFDGDLLIFGARQDQVCAPEVVEGYLDNARRARSAEVVWFEDCDHFVHRWLPDRPSPREETVRAVLRLLSV